MPFSLRQITLIVCVSGSILPGCDRLNKVIPIPVPQGVDGTTAQTETAAYSEAREPQPFDRRFDLQHLRLFGEK